MTPPPKVAAVAAEDQAPLIKVEPFEFPLGRSPVKAYLARCAAGASRNTISQALRWLANLASGGEVPSDLFPWHKLTYPETLALASAAIEHYTPSGAALRIAALRGVLRESWRLEWMDAEGYHRAIDLPPARGSSLPRGRYIPRGEMLALFDSLASDSRPIARRDAAIFAVAYGCGLRRAELAALDVADWDDAAETLKVRGKGRRMRSSAAVGGTSAALRDWLKVRNGAAKALFLAANKYGQIVQRRLTASAIWHMCARRAKAAGVPAFTMHDFRRSHASDLLELGVDIKTVGDQLGHASIRTTAIYDVRGDQSRRKAVELLHVPVRTINAT